MATIIFAYLFSFVFSIIIMFQIMTNRIKMMSVCVDHYNYLRYDCMISNVTETKYGNEIGILSTIFVIPVLFFLMFHVMDLLRIKTYYKNYYVDKDKLSTIDFSIVKSESIFSKISKLNFNLIDIDVLHNDKYNIIKIPI